MAARSRKNETSEEERAFLSAIYAAPDELAPRLVYSDWLIERSDPRGQLIALLCSWETMPDGERREAVRHQAVTLWQSLPPPVDAPELTWFYERGFPVRLHSTSLEVLLRLGEKLFDAAPLLQHVVVTEPPVDGAVRELLGAPWFPRVRSLGWLGVDARAIDALVDRRLATLTELTLGFSVRGDADEHLAGLGHNPHLRALRGFRLAMGRASDAGFEALLARGYLRELRTLEASHNDLGPRSMAAIEHGLPKLREVLLYGNRRLGVGGVRRLAKLPELAVLTISSVVKEVACTDLAAHPRLERLSLRECNLTDAGAMLLLPLADRLVSLDLRHNGLSKKTITELKKAFGDRVAA
jgi:uncharacterized protein (TIGR02996 family)